MIIVSNIKYSPQIVFIVIITLKSRTQFPYEKNSAILNVKAREPMAKAVENIINCNV